MAKETENKRVVKLKKTYSFEGSTYEEIDLSGLDDLSGQDLIEADRIFHTSGQMAPVPEMTLGFAFILASQVTKQPIEFFSGLPAADALKVRAQVASFLNS